MGNDEDLNDVMKEIFDKMGRTGPMKVQKVPQAPPMPKYMDGTGTKKRRLSRKHIKSIKFAFVQ